MLIEFFNAFVKLTGYPAQKIVFRTKVYYENKKVQNRNIKGPAVIICNHTSVWDYGILLFVFFSRTVRAQMAELLFEKKPLNVFLKMMGGIRINRNSFEFGSMAKTQNVLDKGGVVLVFPEGRLPLKNEERPLPFKAGAAYLGLMNGVPIIPVFTNGAYFCKKRARVIIGTAIDAQELADDKLTEKENLENISGILREKIISLENQLNERTKKS